MDKIVIVIFTYTNGRGVRSTRINVKSALNLMKNDFYIHDIGEAIIYKAVEKVYGKNCFFHHSQTESFRPGQIFKRLKNCNTSVTGMLDVEIIGKFRNRGESVK